jgi:hypothetical protein
MKKIYTLILLAFLPILIHAQIPNNSFEDWTSTGNYNVPDQWGNLNSVTEASGSFTCIKGTPGNPGNSYLKLISKEITGMGVVPGIAVCGTLNTLTRTPVSGFPYSGRPESIDGNWQFMAEGEDQGYISVLLSKWNQTENRRDTIAFCYNPLPGMIMSWRSFSFPLNYLSSQNPDSAIIVASASNANGSVTANYSYLYLDNLSFAGSVAGVGEKSAGSISVYPNPAEDYIKITPSGSKTSVKAMICDPKGTILSEIEINGATNISISNYPSGVYFIRTSEGKSAKFIKR